VNPAPPPRTAGTRSRGVVVLAALVFVALAVAARIVGVLPADTSLQAALLAWVSPSLLRVLHAVNHLGDWRVLLPLTIVLVVAVPAARRQWWIWAGLMLLATAMPDVIKELVGRPRPEKVSLGFPSGHATAAAAFFGAVVYLAGDLPRAWRVAVQIVAVAAMVVVGATRVMLRAHWPSDAVGGIALGVTLAAGAAWLSAGRAAAPTPSETSLTPRSG
jgi:membrane-associated phospholipid phosphatase